MNNLMGTDVWARHFRRVASITTRPPRTEGNRTDRNLDQRDHLFVTEETFEQWVEQDAFAEWAFVHGFRYGTLAESLEEMRQSGTLVLKELDVQGLLTLRERYPDQILSVFLTISPEEIRRRLLDRGNTVNIETRVATAESELRLADSFDYRIDTTDIAPEQTLAVLLEIVRQEMLNHDSGLI